MLNLQSNDDIHVEESFLELYSKDLDGKRLVRQLNLIPDFITEMKKRPQHKNLKQITNIRVFAEMLKAVPLTLTLYSEVIKLVKLYLLLNTFLRLWLVYFAQSK